MCVRTLDYRSVLRMTDIPGTLETLSHQFFLTTPNMHGIYIYDFNPWGMSHACRT